MAVVERTGREAARSGPGLFSVVTLVGLCAMPALPRAQTTETLALRGRPQSLRVYGARGGPPVVVSSGDGGWIHLGPHVAQALAAKGYFVGVSEGAGLSVLAATDPLTKAAIAGVVWLGLPDVNELGWR